MSAITELQRLSQSYVMHSCAGECAFDIRLDTDLYTKDALWITGQTPEGTAAKALREIAKHRNGRPRLVSITQIAGLPELEVAS